MKNKKGDVPITILVIGVVAICGLALFGFFHSTAQFKDSFQGVEKIQEARIQIENNSLETYSYELPKRKFQFSLEGDWYKEEVVFSVQYDEKAYN